MTGTVSTVPKQPRRRELSDLAQRIDSRLGLTAILILAIAARAWNLFGYPAFSDDEGTYMAQAWAVQNGLGMAHYTYVYDHPPLGWIQISALSWIPTLVSPTLPAVAAGRVVMLVFAALSIVLLHGVARRLGFSRWAALVATALFSFSPLAIALHRQVFLDNVAVTWILAAFFLALSPRRHLWIQGMAGVTAAGAVLSKETLILTVPAVAYALWQNSHPNTRDFAMIGFVCGFVTTTLFFPLFALLKGELLWRDHDHVSMLEMLAYQLFERKGSGSVLDPGSDAYQILVGWSLQDTAILIAGSVSVIAGLVIAHLRAAALAVLIPTLVVLARPSGYLPGMLVVQLLPFFALTIVGVVVVLAERVRVAARAKRLWWLPAAACAAAFVALLLVVPHWRDSNQRNWTASTNDPYVQTVLWFKRQGVTSERRILTDDTVWLDLVKLGYDPKRQILWHYKVDLDREVHQQLANGWRDLDYIVSTPTVRRTAPDLPTVAAALQNSQVVAAFGNGDDRVEIRKITR
jgi:4-amino-4-deoxy-L-arabinose transferase-like glycosyltransferase